MNSVAAFLQYIEAEKNYSAHTVLAYQKDIEAFQSFMVTTYEQEEIESVNYAQIRSWIVSLVESGITNRSINRKIASLKAYYKFLLRIKQITVNPLAKHTALKVAGKVQVPFSEKEMQTVISDLQKDTSFKGLRDRLIVEMFYATGIRRSELVNLKVSDVDLGAKVIKVLGKRNKERLVPLLPFLIETIQLYLSSVKDIINLSADNYLFIAESGNKVSESFVYRVINSYFSKASTKEKKSPHVLRHTFATHLLNNGADLNSVKELLGHASLASTQHYTHTSIAELKKNYQQAHPRNKE